MGPFIKLIIPLYLSNVSYLLMVAKVFILSRSIENPDCSGVIFPPRRFLIEQGGIPLQVAHI